MRIALAAILCGCMALPTGATEPDKTVSGIETENISKTLSPGDNFYEYVNERWLKETEIPADRSNFGSFSTLDDGVKDAIRKIIEEAAKSGAANGTDAQKIGDFYKSLTNVELRNKLGTKPAEPMLKMVREAGSLEAIATMAAELMKRGIVGPIACYIGPDAKKSDEYTVYVTQSGLSLPDRDYYLEDGKRYSDAREALRQYAEDMFKSFGFSDPKASAERIVELETALAEIQWDKVENRDPDRTYNKISNDDFCNMLVAGDMRTFLSVLGLKDQANFIVRQPSYIEALNEIAPEYTEAHWKDYYSFQIIDAMATDLTEDLEKRHFDFHATALSGIEEQKPLWRRGVEACNGVLGEILGKLYVEQYFPPEAKQRMDELVGNLKKAFAKRIEANEWMSPATKKEALLKLSKFTTKIGYPDEWKDYSKLEIKADDLVGNYIRASLVAFEREINKLGGPIDRNEWFMTPQTINAYYNPTMNEIVFPAAILQPPFFNLKADDAVNYGGIGGVIGHEISHGFDDKGSKYDGDGNLRKWWTVEDRESFEGRAGKLVDQYSAYKPFDDMNVNGEFTLGENIGDLGGMAVAYEAYQMSLEGKEAPVIDGLSGNQRFFLGWAQIWRRLYRESELRKRLLTDPHSPSEYRCNGIVSNMDAFYETFSIKPGDKMYIAPEKRVRIW